MSNKKIFLVFKDARETILAERECFKNGYQCLAVPTPGQCGILLEVPVEHQSEVVKLLKKQKKDFKYF